jgi:uncharacterized membrane protein YgcG
MKPQIFFNRVKQRGYRRHANGMWYNPKSRVAFKPLGNFVKIYALRKSAMGGAALVATDDQLHSMATVADMVVADPMVTVDHIVVDPPVNPPVGGGSRIDRINRDLLLEPVGYKEMNPAMDLRLIAREDINELPFNPPPADTPPADDPTNGGTGGNGGGNGGTGGGGGGTGGGTGSGNTGEEKTFFQRFNWLIIAAVIVLILMNNE